METCYVRISIRRSVMCCRNLKSITILAEEWENLDFRILRVAYSWKHLHIFQFSKLNSLLCSHSMIHFHAMLPRHKEAGNWLTFYRKADPRHLNKHQKDLRDWCRGIFLLTSAIINCPSADFPTIPFSLGWHKIREMYQHQSSKFRELRQCPN